jgi:hypothetical protein
VPVTTFTEEEIKAIATEIRNQVVPVILREVHEKQLPPLMTRKQFMELVDIGPTKCNELFNRADFPVTRELGHPRVPTKEFLEWVSQNTNRAEEVNLSYPYRVI